MYGLIVPQFISQPDAAQTALVLILIPLVGGTIDYMCQAWKEHHQLRIAITEASAALGDGRTKCARLVLSALNTTRHEVKLVSAGVRLPDGTGLQLSEGLLFPCTLCAFGGCESNIDSFYLNRVAHIEHLRARLS